MKTFLLLLNALTVALSVSADTNIVYFFIDHRGAMGENAKARAHERQMDAAKELPECRPAELDPQGNWGQIVAGLQLSLRFPTNVFIAGEPIGVTVILRNTSD